MKTGKKELVYKIMLFTLKDHTTWRMTTESAFNVMNKTNVTASKVIIIDRLNGEVKTK